MELRLKGVRVRLVVGEGWERWGRDPGRKEGWRKVHGLLRVVCLPARTPARLYFAGVIFKVLELHGCKRVFCCLTASFLLTANGT